MSNIIDFNVEFNSDAINKRIDSLIDDTVMTEIHQLFLDMCEPYVPKKTGRLRRSAVASSNGVTYGVDYAKDVYENNVGTSEGITSREWDKVMMRDQSDAFIEGVKEILIRRAKEIYG